MGLKNMKKNTGNIKRALKILTYGTHNTGKTKFALSFPNIASVDTEDGQAFYRSQSNIKYIQTTTSASQVEDILDEIIEEYESLREEVSTFVLDSETKIYENQQHSALALVEKRARRKKQPVDDASLSQREWGKIKQISKRIKAKQIWLASKGINVVSVCQEKAIKVKKGDEYVIVGYAPDAAKGIEYDFDIIIRQYTKKNPKTTELEYFAEVQKDRTGTFKVGTVIQNPTYEDWEEAFKTGATGKEEEFETTHDIDLDEENMVGDNFEELKKTFQKYLAILNEEQKQTIREMFVEYNINLTDPTSVDNLKVVIQKIEKMIG